MVIVDPENSHKRTLDLSGEGASRAASGLLLTRPLRQPEEHDSFRSSSSIRRSSQPAHTQAGRSWQSFTETPSDPRLLRWVPLGG